MEIIKANTRYDFLSKSRGFLTISGALVVLAWALVGIRGLNYGIDFAGGTEVLMAFGETVPPNELREAVTTLGFDHAEVVTYGLTDEGRYFVRSRTQTLLTQADIDKIRAAVVEKVAEPSLWDATDEAGEEIRVRFTAELAKPELKTTLKEALSAAGFAKGEVTTQTTGGSNPVYVLRLPTVRDRLTDGLSALYKDRFKSIERLESVGSAVGKQMREQGALAILYAIVLILLYIWFRFDSRYWPGAILALVHDVSITVGIFSVFWMEFSLPIIAALLAIVGYSLNDTIVVYDRIRESVAVGVAKTLRETINISINDCLSRTLLTSVSTLIAVLAIYVFGGGIITNFAFAMLIGVVVGTYSSIYIASPMVLAMDKRQAHRLAAQSPKSGAGPNKANKAARPVAR